MCRHLQVQHPYSHPFTSHHPSLVPTGFHAAEAQTDRVGAGADPIGRLEEELIQLGDASGQVGVFVKISTPQVNNPHAHTVVLWRPEPSL